MGTSFNTLTYTMPAATTNVPVSLGLMTWGREGVEMARVHDLAGCEKMLDVFLAHGHNEVDSALIYGEGSSEEYLGQIDWKGRGVVVDTKLAPGQYAGRDVKFTLDSMRKYIDVHLEAVNTLHKEGKFERFGVSNYSAAQVDDFCAIADKKGWIKPTAYQGIYNALHRSVEKELFPVLRKHGISFYEFNPLGGGIFTGQLKRDNEVEKGSRFDPNTAQGKNYRQRYWRDEYFQALDLIEPVAKSNNLTLAEIALRWVSHHSLLSRDKGDNILIGASSVKHLESNLVDLEKGPLPQDVLDALDKAWDLVKEVASPYHR